MTQSHESNHRCKYEAHSFEFEVVERAVVFTCVNCRYSVLPDKQDVATSFSRQFERSQAF